MGQGGSITLVNGTPYTWALTHQHSYQMNAWSFPSSIGPFSSTQTIYVEWDQSIFDKQSDDGGEAVYALENTPYSFQIQARATSGFDLQVYFTNLSTMNNPSGSTLSLGWVHDGDVQFILAGNAGSFFSSNPPMAWMQSNLASLGERTLRRLCLPGAHDAGMSQLNAHTAGVFDCNVITQGKDILGQLQSGIRYFDIRPVISGGSYYTGHYSNTSSVAGWQGGNGQSIDDIIGDINTFLSQNNELVIVNLSHDVNTDVGEPNYRALNQDEWNALMAKLSGLNSRFTTPPPVDIDLTTQTLATFIGQNNPAVVVVVSPSDSSIELGQYAGQGFYTESNFQLYNDYSNSNDLNTMVSDQLQKMKQQRTTPDSTPFLLSWTLTQDTEQAVGCFTGAESSILNLADTANPAIYANLMPACTDQCYPNVLYIDDVSTSNIVALAMAVNTLAGA